MEKFKGTNTFASHCRYTHVIHVYTCYSCIQPVGQAQPEKETFTQQEEKCAELKKQKTGCHAGDLSNARERLNTKGGSVTNLVVHFLVC